MTVLGVLLLAMFDSINPSAIVVTLFLLSAAPSRAHRQIPVYVATIFATYLALGVVMVLGLESALPALSDRAGFVVQALVGLALLAYAFSARRRTSPAARPPAAHGVAALVLLGVTVTVMELPTAVPYLAAIGLVTEARWPASSWLPLLVVYNVIFVLPPLALLAGHLVLRERVTSAYAAIAARVEREAQGAAVWIAGLVGGALLLTGVIEVVARLR